VGLEITHQHIRSLESGIILNFETKEKSHQEKDKSLSELIFNSQAPSDLTEWVFDWKNNTWQLWNSRLPCNII